MIKTNKSFLAFGAEVIGECRLAGRLGTARNYERSLRSFATFLGGMRPAGELTFGEVTPGLLVDYEHWLAARGVVRNSSSFYMRNLRAIYNRATGAGAAVAAGVAAGVAVGVAAGMGAGFAGSGTGGVAGMVAVGELFRGVYKGIDRTRKRAADEDLVVRLLSLDLSSSAALALARDLFVFSYCTRGMAFVDVAFLRKDDVRDGVISYVRRKTGQRLTVGLEPCIELIMKRYDVETADSPYVFPIITSENPEVAYTQYQIALNYHNRKLKRIASLLGEPLRLSTYTARHTWATAARNHQVPLSVISAGMGHTSEKTTQIYLADLDTSVIDQANRGILGKINCVVSA